MLDTMFSGTAQTVRPLVRLVATKRAQANPRVMMLIQVTMWIKRANQVRRLVLQAPTTQIQGQQALQLVEMPTQGITCHPLAEPVDGLSGWNLPADYRSELM